jgi:hypothetical protein
MPIFELAGGVPLKLAIAKRSKDESALALALSLLNNTPNIEYYGLIDVKAVV